MSCLALKEEAGSNTSTTLAKLARRALRKPLRRLKQLRRTVRARKRAVERQGEGVPVLEIADRRLERCSSPVLRRVARRCNKLKLREKEKQAKQQKPNQQQNKKKTLAKKKSPPSSKQRRASAPACYNFSPTKK